MKIQRTKDLKSLSLVCRSFYGLVVEILWKCPTFNWHKAYKLDLSKLKHLPIQELDIPRLRRNWIESISSFSLLTTLTLSYEILERLCMSNYPHREISILIGK